MAMPGDTRHTQSVELTFKYSEEIAENHIPASGKPEIVIAPGEYARIRRDQVNRTFYFLTACSALCIGTVALVPQPAVQATALAIWAGSSGFARHLLSGAAQKPDKPIDR
jgi:hypothetical protein